MGVEGKWECVGMCLQESLELEKANVKIHVGSHFITLQPDTWLMTVYKGATKRAGKTKYPS